MKNLYIFLTLLFGSIMILAGILHFIKPHAYDGFIPDSMPKVLVNYSTGVIEICIGIGTCTKSCRWQATLALFFLMVAFLPLHAVDVFKEQPAIGSHLIALIRLPLQIILIAWAWFIHVGSRHAT